MLQNLFQDKELLLAIVSVSALTCLSYLGYIIGSALLEREHDDTAEDVLEGLENSRSMSSSSEANARKS
jgi:hypothetical protein